MKAAIYNPYLDTLGGGERYTLTFAKVLVDSGWDVDLEWKDVEIKEKLENRFGMDLKSINIVSDIKRGDGYDLCFWVSDGSVPTLKSRKNILHFQVPFHDVNGKSLLNRMKMIRINKIICNSEFTKKIIDREYGVKSDVIYPPVSVNQIKSKRKENSILYVGRFSELKQNKGQEVLINAFKKLYNSGVKDWELILAGGTEVGSEEFLKRLEKSISGYKIKIIKSPNFKELVNIYGKSKIFWSASGFEISEIQNPEKVEHFGMTVVEAMAAGTVPIIYNAGGHKEIINNGINGFLWTKISNLVSDTKKLILDNSSWVKVSIQTKKDSFKFSNEVFKERVLELIK